MTISYTAYCVIDSNLAMPEGIMGVQDGEVWNLRYREIGVVVSELTGPIHDVAAGAVEHEDVVERLMERYTVLPMRFPTIFVGREAILGMMARHYDRFREDQLRLRDHVEFGLRVLWPTAAEQEATEELVPPARECSTAYAAKPSGTQYLQQRCRQRKCHRAQWERAIRLGHKLDLALGVLATTKQLRPIAAGGFAFDGAYLIHRDREADFRRAFAEVKSTEPEFRYLFSGPWPPYNFVTTPAASGRCTTPATGSVANDLIGCLGLLGGVRDTRS